MNINEEDKNSLIEILSKSLGINKEDLDIKIGNIDQLKELLSKNPCIPENPMPSYPSLSIGEGNMYLKIMHEMADNDNEGKYIGYMRYIIHVMSHLDEIDDIINTFKKIMVNKNRTTAIMNCLGFGIFLGLFLGRPDLVPVFGEEKVIEMEEEE